jgi:hypothetical protein
MSENELAIIAVDICYKIHTAPGPEPLESVYEAVLPANPIKEEFIIKEFIEKYKGNYFSFPKTGEISLCLCGTNNENEKTKEGIDCSINADNCFYWLCRNRNP